MVEGESDALEREVRRIARRKNGEPVKMQDLWDLIMASDEDATTRDRRRRADHKATVERIDKLTVAGSVRDARLLNIETCIKHDHDRFEERVTTIAVGEHEKRHAAYVAGITVKAAQVGRDGESLDHTDERAPVLVAVENDPPLKYTREQLVANFWWVVGGLALVAVVGGLFGGLTDYVLTVIGWK